jgi:hypothetical protein
MSPDEYTQNFADRFYVARRERQEAHQDWTPQLGEPVNVLSNFESLRDDRFVYYEGYVLSDDDGLYSIYDVMAKKVTYAWKREELIPSSMFGGNAKDGHVFMKNAAGTTVCAITVKGKQSTFITAQLDVELFPVLEHLVWFMYVVFWGKVFYAES